MREPGMKNTKRNGDNESENEGIVVVARGKFKVRGDRELEYCGRDLGWKEGCIAVWHGCCLRGRGAVVQSRERAWRRSCSQRQMGMMSPGGSFFVFFVFCF